MFPFHLLLIGRAVGWAKPVFTAWAALGRNGLGPGGGRYVIERVCSRAPGMAGEAQTVYARDSGEWCDPAAGPLGRWAPEHWSGARRVQARFCTPTRVYSDGCVTRSPAFSELVRALLRRASSLAYFHCGRALELDFARLVSEARGVRMRMAQTWWQRQSRYSKRQGQHVDMSGLLGRIEYEAESVEALARYRDLLAAGSWLHVGKGTVMGLVKYEVSMASSCRQQERGKRCTWC
ncbi:MAG: CRISPR system precrRNA processing endoribonuclease RAMP protein Cas6 [Pirellulales bacterium]|nr:CRISPR system precrRNA processing endoribonuclease RAMP protein Cas6 [Pirellulales bacterium]